MSFLRVKGFLTGFTALSSVVQAKKTSDPHVFSFQKSVSQCEVAYMIGSTNELSTQAVIPAKQNILRKKAVDISAGFTLSCVERRKVMNGTGFKFICHLLKNTDDILNLSS